MAAIRPPRDCQAFPHDRQPPKSRAMNIPLSGLHWDVISESANLRKMGGGMWGAVRFVFWFLRKTGESLV